MLRPRPRPARVAEQPAVSAEERYTALCDTARRQLLDGSHDDAVQSARDALNLLPRGVEAQRLLGLALLERGEARQAISAFQGALSCDPLDVIAQTGVAEASEQLNGAAAAEAEWRRAWELEPGVAQVEERLQAARQAAGVLDAREALPLTRPALVRVYLRGGLFEHAAAEARALLARDGDRPDLQLALAEAFWKLGDPEAAAAIAASLVERLPDCTMANLLVAAYWQMVGRDISGLMARVRCVDPAGTIAARLFDDRDAPPLLEAEAAAAPWQRPERPEFAFTATPIEPAHEGDLAATVPLPAVAPVEARDGGAAERGEAHDEVDVTGEARQPTEATEPETHTEPEAHVAEVAVGAAEDAQEAAGDAEDAAEQEEEEPRAEVGEQEVAPAAEPEGAPPAEPKETLQAEVSNAPETPQTAAQARAAGDAAMQNRRYFDALRAYGQALRLMRDEAEQ